MKVEQEKRSRLKEHLQLRVGNRLVNAVNEELGGITFIQHDENIFSKLSNLK